MRNLTSISLTCSLERLHLSKISFVAIDEADTMFAKDFKDDVLRILTPLVRLVREGKRTASLLFAAATLSKLLLSEVGSISPVRCFSIFSLCSHSCLKECERLITPSVHKVVASVRQEFIRCDADKPQVLKGILSSLPDRSKTMIFCNTLDSSRWLDKFLAENGFSAALVHGGVPPRDRKAQYQRFTSGSVSILVCSDVAARGLDTIVDAVILFDFPLNVVDYLHRVGRTGRAGRSGVAYSLIRKREVDLANSIQRSIQLGYSLDEVASGAQAQ